MQIFLVLNITTAVVCPSTSCVIYVSAGHFSFHITEYFSLSISTVISVLPCLYFVTIMIVHFSVHCGLMAAAMKILICLVFKTS